MRRKTVRYAVNAILFAFALVVLVAFGSAAFAGTVTLFWPPAADATGYRLEWNKDGGSWSRRDIPHKAGRPFDVQYYRMTNVADGLRCFRVRSLGADNYVSAPTEPACVTLPRTSAEVVAQSGTWIHCAGENARCNFSGTRRVRYGAATSWNYQTATGGIDCNNSVFGDPIRGNYKTCEFEQ